MMIQGKILQTVGTAVYLIFSQLVNVSHDRSYYSWSLFHGSRILGMLVIARPKNVVDGEKELYGPEL